MLKLSLPKRDVWDEETEEFKTIGGKIVELEHSLFTVGEWESKWKKPFANKKGLDRKMLLDYIINFMCQTSGISREDWLTIDQDTINAISEYMNDPHTATTIKKINNAQGRSKNETVTAELLYCYMVQLGIPFSCEHWHLNRLLTFIEVCSIKASPPKKMSKKEAAAMWAKQNAEMRSKLGSRG